RYRGELPAELERRTDLSAAYIEAVVRDGYLSMPFFRPTELSDDDLEALIAYLTRIARAGRPSSSRSSISVARAVVDQCLHHRGLEVVAKLPARLEERGLRHEDADDPLLGIDEEMRVER